MRGILFDLDGVVYNSEQPIKGADQTVAWVQKEEIPYLFVTNTTSRGREALVQKLLRFGITTDTEHILTPCVTAAAWLRTREDVRASLFVDARGRGEFHGIQQVPEDAETGASHVVVGDLGEHWDYQTLNRAFRLLHSNPVAELIALGMTPFWHADDGLRLDTAPFVVALEHASRRKARVFGKPEISFFHAAAQKLELPPGEIAMIGDAIETDVKGAQMAGMKGVLVRTGKFRESDLQEDIRPDAVLDSIADLPKWAKKAVVSSQ